MKKLNKLICLLLLWQATNAVAQDQDFNWAVQGQGPGTNTAIDLATDAAGNVVITGRIQSTVNFGDITINASNFPGYDHYMAKYSSDGELLWVRRKGYGGTTLGRKIVSDADQNIYAAGDFRGSVIFGGEQGNSDFQLNSGIGRDAFVQKTDSMGITEWMIRVVPGTSNSQTEVKGEGLAIDSEGFLFFGGIFQESAVFEFIDGLGNIQPMGSVSSPDINDIYLAKVATDIKNPVSAIQWTVVGNGNGLVTLTDLTCHEDSFLYVAGHFEDTLNFNGNEIYSNNFSRDGFLVKLDNATGSYQWGIAMGGTQVERVNEVITDSGGDVYVTGDFTGDFTIGGVTYMSSAGFTDGFIAKFNGDDGTLIWIRQFSGPEAEYGHGLAVTDDRLFVTGVIGGGTVSFLNGSSADTSLVSTGGFDVFLAQYDIDGTFRSVKHVLGSPGDDDAGLALGYHARSNRLFMAGHHLSSPLRFEEENPDLDLTHPDNQPNIFLTSLGSDTAVVVNVTQMIPDEAAIVELFSLDHDGSSVYQPIVEGKAVFMGSDIQHEGQDMDIEEIYLLRADSSLIGRIHFVYKAKNNDAGRVKEVLVTLHNDLVSYQDHPVEGTNLEWLLKNRYRFDYKGKPLFSNEGEPINSVHYPTTMLVPPPEDGEYRLSNADENLKPLIFVHGWTDIDQTWGGRAAGLKAPNIKDVDIVDPDTDNEANDFNGKIDYAYTAIPARLRVRPGNQLDPWEFYYPPDQSWDESSFLLKRAIERVLQDYPSENKVSLVGFSMGGLVAGGYISGVGKAYDRSGLSLTGPATDYAFNVENFLVMASPQHGAFSGYRTYWGIYDTNKVSPFAGKDHEAPALKMLGPGDSPLLAMMRNRLTSRPPGNQGVPNEDGVTYFALTGNKEFSSWITESRFHADGAVPISSGSLLEYGVDLGVVDGFSHGDFPRLDNFPNPEKQLIPDIIEDFMADGQVSVASRNRMAAYIEADVLQFPDSPLANTEVRTHLDVAAPIVVFKKQDGETWRPTYEGPTGGVRFRIRQLEDSEDTAIVLEHGQVPSTVLDEYNDQGMYLYYGDNRYINPSGSPFKVQLPKNHEAFYPYEVAVRLPFKPGNPLDFSEEGSDITLRGYGWQMPNTQELNLDVYLSYSVPRFANLLPGVRRKKYYRIPDKLQLKWCSPTYNELSLDDAALEIAEGKEIYDGNLPGNLANARNQEGRTMMGSGTLFNIVDVHAAAAGFILSYPEGSTAPALSLSSPSGTVLQESDTSPDVLFTDVPALGVKYFVIRNPQQGRWDVLIDGVSQLPAGEDYALDFMLNTKNLLRLDVDTARCPGPGRLVIEAYIENTTGAVIANQQIEAYYYLTDSAVAGQALLFSDDGTGLDEVAGDGTFTALFERPDFKAYEIVAVSTGEMDNSGFIRQEVLSLPYSDLELNFSSTAESVVCLGDSIYFTGEINPFESPKEISWDFGDGNIASEQETAHLYNQPGTYDVIFKVSTIAGVLDSVVYQVTVSPEPDVNIQFSGSPGLCAGDSLTLDAGAGFDEYLWNTGDTTQAITVSEAGDYFVSAMSAGSCFGTSDTITVTVSPLPDPVTISVKGATDICSDESVTLNAGQGYDSYLWSPGGETTQAITVNTAGLYSVEVFNAAGCSALSDTVAVNVSPSPQPIIVSAGEPVICDGDSLVLDATPDAGPHFASYLWSPGGETTPFIKIGEPGEYTVVVTNNEGCSGSDTIDVTGLSFDTSFEIHIPKDTCTGSPYILSYDNPQPDVTYIWQISSNIIRTITGPGPHQLDFTCGGELEVTLVATQGECMTGTTNSVFVKPYCDGEFPAPALTAASCNANVDVDEFIEWEAIATPCLQPVYRINPGYQVEFTNQQTGEVTVSRTFNGGNRLGYNALTSVEGPGFGVFDVRVRVMLIHDPEPIVGPWGPTCRVAIIPQTRVEAKYCGTTFNDLSGALACEVVAGADNYEFRFTGNGGEIFYSPGDGSNEIDLANVTGLDCNEDYLVHARAILGGISGDFSTENCEISFTPTTIVQTWSHTGQGYFQQFYAKANDCADGYRWSLQEVCQISPCSQPVIYDSQGREFNFSWVSSQVSLGVFYDVKVAVISDNGQVGPYSAAKRVKYDPLPLTQLTDCDGLTLYKKQQYLYWDYVNGATAYVLKFTRSAGGSTFYVVSNSVLNRYWLDNINGLEYGQSYHVEVRAQFGSNHGDFGTACQLDLLVPLGIITRTCPQDLRLTDVIVADNGSQVNGCCNITQYHWEVTHTNGFVQNIYTSNNSMAINEINGVQSGDTYQVRIRPRIGVANGAWSDYCEVNIVNSRTKNFFGQAVRSREEDLKITDDIATTIYPNPVSGNLLHVKASMEIDEIEIYNSVGQKVLADLVESEEREGLTIDVSSLGSGLYLIYLRSDTSIEKHQFIKK